MDELQSQFETIADGLADLGISVTDGFLSSEELYAIRSLPLLSGPISDLRRAGIGKGSPQINEGIRGDHIEWLGTESAPEPLKDYLSRMEALRQFLNQSLFLGLKDFEAHVARYPAGAFYKRHLDQFRKDDHRRISVICYLNHDWIEDDGGQLRVYFDNEHTDYLPIGGRLVCFRSDLLEHEVLPARRERSSITGWLLDRIQS